MVPPSKGIYLAGSEMAQFLLLISISIERLSIGLVVTDLLLPFLETLPAYLEIGRIPASFSYSSKIGCFLECFDA